MRVLYYNWVDYLDLEHRGGGVSVYLRNLLSTLQSKAFAEISPTFLCSGLSHDLIGSRNVRWEKLRHGPPSAGVNRYELVNAAPLAPGHAAWADPAQLRHPQTEAAFLDFIRQTGPYDVVHFHNLEGLPIGVLAALKRAFPKTRSVVTLHNYYAFCPQVNLWHQERAACQDDQGGLACVDCLTYQPPRRTIKLAHAVAYFLKSHGVVPQTWLWNFSFNVLLRRAHAVYRRFAQFKRTYIKAAGKSQPSVVHFQQRRPDIIKILNTYVDCILAVSKRVAEIAETFGVCPDRLRTCYIGTHYAKAWCVTTPKICPPPERPLEITYLGYMRADKGFFFLLEALEALPSEIAAQIVLRVAAKPGPPHVMDRLRTLSARFAAFYYHAGYDHDGLDDILKTTDIGLVPVLWEDNLPQVALEMHSRHIPLLTSDLGGAQELGGGSDMVFPAGDKTAFSNLLSDILNGEIDFNIYWRDARIPIAMTDHIDALKTHYKSKLSVPAQG